MEYFPLQKHLVPFHRVDTLWWAIWGPYVRCGWSTSGRASPVPSLDLTDGRLVTMMKSAEETLLFPQWLWLENKSIERRTQNKYIFHHEIEALTLCLPIENNYLSFIPEGHIFSVRTRWEQLDVPSVGEHGSGRSLTVSMGDKGCTASSEFLLSCPVFSSSVWSCCLKQSFSGMSGWALLDLTRNERGMVSEGSERWGDDMLFYKSAGVWQVNPFMSLLEPGTLRRCTPVDASSVKMPKLEVSLTNEAPAVKLEGFHGG